MIVSMQLGFAMLEVGCVRQEHRMTVLEPRRYKKRRNVVAVHVQNSEKNMLDFSKNDGIHGGDYDDMMIMGIFCSKKWGCLAAHVVVEHWNHPHSHSL